MTNMPCTTRIVLAVGVSVLSLFTASAIAESPDQASRELYFPPVEGRDWEAVDPADAGWNPEALEAVFEYAEVNRSTGFVILWNGRMLAERYWPPPAELASRPELLEQFTYHGRTAEGWLREDVASTQKSVISFLVGIAKAKGLIDIEDPASAYLGEGWSNASPEQEKQITVRHLLSMASGLDRQLGYEKPAGTYWSYNTTAYGRVADVLENASGHDLNTLSREWLNERIGMTDSFWWKRPGKPGAPPSNANGLVTTPRDLARFGLLVLNNGVWNTTDVIGDPSWIETSRSSSQESNLAYGYLWWLNGKESRRSARSAEPVPGPLISSAPADLFAAMGAMDRRLYIVPSMSLVITRLGGPAGKGFDRELWELVMKAAPPSPSS
jgi:hypothetical protein